MHSTLTAYLQAASAESSTTLDQALSARFARTMLDSVVLHDMAAAGNDIHDPLLDHVEFAIDLGGTAAVVALRVQELLVEHDELARVILAAQ